MINISFYNLYFRALCIVVLTLNGIVMPHGFSSHTMIAMPHDEGLMSIDHMANYKQQKKHDVASYDTRTRKFVKNCVKATSVRKSNCFFVISFKQCNASDIACTYAQQFYKVSDRTWIAAHKIEQGDVLLCRDNTFCQVASVMLINEPLEVYTIEVENTHTFLVGRQGLVTHNTVIPMITMAGLSIPLSTGCGGTIGAPLGPVGICAGIVIGGAIGYIINSCVSKKTSGNSLAFDVNKIKSCSTHNNPDKQHKGNKQDPKKPRNTDRFANMYEVFEKAAIGKTLKECSESTSCAYKDGAKIFKVIKDIAEYGIKKGDWFYLDKMHGDHIEVFKKFGSPMRTILNMDGTQNFNKLKQAGARTIKQWIK
ncbi:MAG: polymorphic toxin-type HINT domain-containing protein [Candidatus Babeliales bacterium]|nr:polymorphic toxin-type HINT domain-containing protein [Candidatus Babeliales bacterium]